MFMNFVRRIVDKEFPFILAAPALLWQCYFLYVPLFFLIAYSFLSYTSTGSYQITLMYYRELFQPPYAQVFIRSLVLAFSTSVGCLLLGYPIAHFLAMKAGRFKIGLLAFLILPSWTSFIVQVYAWFFLLKKEGIIAKALTSCGIVESTTSLLNSPIAIMIGMIYCYLPFMVFPLFAVLERIDKELLEASADLGANRYQTFLRIIAPLSYPGIATGFLLVFVPAFGEFAVPDLLGGGKTVFLGNVIVDKFLFYRNWQSGSAAALLGVVLPLASMVLTVYFVSAIRSKMRKKHTVLVYDAQVHDQGDIHG
jgi:spermidine/putrescine transport system permease protein